MARISLYIFLLVIRYGSLNSQEFVIDTFSKSMMEMANAVVVSDDMDITFKSKSLFTIKVRQKILILNSDGYDKFSSISVGTGKFYKVDNLVGEMRGLSGKILHKLKAKDKVNYNSGINSSDVFDNGVIVSSFDVENMTYPVIIDYSYEQQVENPLFIPKWQPNYGEKVNIISCRYVVKWKDDAKNLVNVYEQNLDPNHFTKSTSPTSFIWEGKNIQGKKRELYSLHHTDPEVILTCKEFTFGGIDGSLNNWKDAGLFFYKLAQGTDSISTIHQKEILNLTKDETTTYGKIKKVYEYMQSKTRYQSIQLGAGGWTPTPAYMIESKGYGDCKALSNYTRAMLKAIGIKSYLAIINAGDNYNPNSIEVPSAWFNHMVLCVPNGQDSIWLECTSQINKIGYCGSFTGNRHALLLTEEGGKLVRTNSYSPYDNMQVRNIEVWLGNDGKAKIVCNNRYSGILHDSRYALFKMADGKQQEEFIIESLNKSNVSLENFKYETDWSQGIPAIREHIKFNTQDLANINGNRLFLKPNLVDLDEKIAKSLEKRESDIYLDENSYNFVYIDTIIYHLPPDYKFESGKDRYELSTEFGTYSYNFNLNADVLTYVRYRKMQGGTFPKSSEDVFVQYHKDINKADNVKAVFIKK